MDLAAVPWRSTRYLGVRIHFYANDANSRRTVALIEMAPGCGYPRHQHRGPEELLVLQGGYRDASGDHRAGSRVRYEDGTSHAPVALDDGDGVPCVLLALAHEGITLLEGGSAVDRPPPARLHTAGSEAEGRPSSATSKEPPGRRRAH